MNISLRSVLLLALIIINWGGGVRVFAQMKAPESWLGYEDVFRVRNGLRHYDFDVLLTESSAPANVFWPGDNIDFKFQIINNTDSRISVDATAHVISYGTRGIENDIWLPQIVRLGTDRKIPVKIEISPNGYTDVPLKIEGIDRFGGYAVVLDLGKHGRRLATSFAYSMQPSPVKMQYPRQSLDDLGVDFLSRVGVQSIRRAIPFISPTDPDYRTFMNELDAQMRRYSDNNITVMLMFGEGRTASSVPLGTGRPHLDAQGRFLHTKQDLAWMPDMDDKFKSYVEEICGRYGWPAGPVTAVCLWNEPWEGSSISGWQADMLRYREIYTKMAEGVIAARDKGADVLVGGGDSNSNALDKFFADGTMDILPIFDFVSIHYQGLEAPVLYPEWNNRTYHKGRVKVWDTESWVGNTDDRIGLVVATNRACGYDRSMGIFGGYMYSGEPNRSQRTMSVRTSRGTETVDKLHNSWSAAAAMGAVQRLVGERDFRELLFRPGLPWIMVFDGYEGNDDDGTVVIAGDLSDAFGADHVLYGSVKRSDNAGMTVKARPEFVLYDFYGNKIDSKNGFYEIPLGCQGYYMRTTGKKNSFKNLLKTLRESRIEGYEPVEIVAEDFTAPLNSGNSAVTLRITNVLNRPVKAKLDAKIAGITLTYPSNVNLKAHETKTVKLQVANGVPAANNTYPLEVCFDAGADGKTVHKEDMHVNYISRRPINVDGNLDEWSGVIPQTLTSSKARISLTEAAWHPYEEFDTNAEGLAQTWLAYDDDNFYFAAKVADSTPHPGTMRFADRADDDFFYPDTAYMSTPRSMKGIMTRVQAGADDRTALCLPDTSARVKNYIENSETVQSIGFDLSLPADRYTRTALYFPAIRQNGVDVAVYDRETGRELLTTGIDKMWDGTYLILDLCGDVRVRCTTRGWWYTVKVGGIFLDSSSRVPAGSVKSAAAMVGKDIDTMGNWPGTYGALGYEIPGAAKNLPEGYDVSVVEFDDYLALPWPEGVRRFTYRKRPVLPDGVNGIATDNILIAFNVIPEGEDGMEICPAGTMPRFTGYKCTDYEYALNTVAPEYGGGFEVWRMLVPGMPRKHFYPRQPSSDYDGAVSGARLNVVRQGNTLYYECSIPWSEMPDVKKAFKSGAPVKFSARVNNDTAGAACMETAVGRSVSKINSRAFHPDWKEHWSNEVIFGVEP